MSGLTLSITVCGIVARGPGTRALQNYIGRLDYDHHRVAGPQVQLFGILVDHEALNFELPYLSYDAIDCRAGLNVFYASRETVAFG